MQSIKINNKCLIVTTINGLNHSGIKKLINQSEEIGYELIVVGDRKTPDWSDLKSKSVRFITIDEQNDSEYESGKIIGENHYGRKIVGYLMAASQGCKWISETDDDNILYPNFWNIPDKAAMVTHNFDGPWVNIYSLFGYPNLWHRGIPIDMVSESNNVNIGKVMPLKMVGVVQGLADGDPDIDAIGRMLYHPVTKFESDKVFQLGPKSLSPTNSQLTHWDAELLPLLYLPHTVPWRVADIWRGLIAQLWMNRNGWETVYVGAVGFQERNQHDLILDFSDEIPVHLQTQLIIDCVQKYADLNMNDYLKQSYTALLDSNLVGIGDLRGIEAYLNDCQKIQD